MVKKDYYKILGVDRNASQEEIKRAFRHLARKYHPDVAGKESEEKFKEINEAFQVLSDPEKRARYDQFGTSAFKPGDFTDFRNFNFEDLFKDFGFGDIFDIFSESKNRRETRAEQGADLKYDIEISLEDAFHGLTKRIEVPMFVVCRACNGTGAKNGVLKECPACRGTGELRRIERSVFGQIINITTCSKCDGTGKIPVGTCRICRGMGRVKTVKKIKVKIPRGVDDGQNLRIVGEGEPGYRGGKPGDLYVVVHIRPHEIFERYENNLFCKTTISLGQAIFGGEITIPTINGRVKVKIPKGTQSHTVFRLKGQGMPDLHTHKRGDQMVKIIVEIPKKLNKRGETLLKEFIKEYGETIKTGKGFFEKMKEYFE